MGHDYMKDDKMRRCLSRQREPYANDFIRAFCNANGLKPRMYMRKAVLLSSNQ